MRTVTYRLEDLQRAVITIGFVGENEHTHVIFDAKRVFDDYPTALPSLTVRPPDGDPYPAVVAREGDLLTWEILDSDLTKDGLGEFQLTFVVDTVVAKTFIGKTRIHKSLMPTGEVPEPIDDWITQANTALSDIPQTINDALEAAKESGEFDGPPGDDGFSPIVSTSEIAGGHRVSIQDATHTEAFDVMDGGADVIDDNAGAGETGKTWSADKLVSELAEKADTSDIPDVSGFYTKPGTGIPKTDLASGVQGSLGKADTAYQKPVDGIPKTDLASGVQGSLGKADAAYQKPSGGIPATDLASGVVPDVTGKADKVTSATSGNFAGLDSNGNLTDSGKKPGDFLTQHQDITGKADKVSSAISGNFAGLDANGNLTDSGHKHSDYLTQHQDISGKTNNSIVAVDYADLTYPVEAGTHCIHDGVYYAAKQDIPTSEAWTAAHWDFVRIGDELSSQKSAITNIEESLNSNLQFTLENKTIYLNSGQDFTYTVSSTARVCTQIIFVPDGFSVYVRARGMGRIAWTSSLNGSTISSSQSFTESTDYGHTFDGPVYFRLLLANATNTTIEPNDVYLESSINSINKKIYSLNNVVMQQPIRTLKNIAIMTSYDGSTGNLSVYEGWETVVYLIEPLVQYTIERPNSNSIVFLLSNILHDKDALALKCIKATGSIINFTNTDRYKYLYIISKMPDSPSYSHNISVKNILEFLPDTKNNIDSNIVCTYKKMYVAKNGNRLLFSGDSMATWTKTLDITGIGLIKTYHLFDNGCIAFFTHTKAYYSEDWVTINESSLLEADGTTYTPSTYDNFTTSRDFHERMYVNGQDLHVFGNYGITDENNTRRIIWASVDNGHTYKVIYEFNVSGAYTIRHIHNVMYNPNFDTFICATGDNASQSHVIEFSYSNGSFSGFTSLGDGLDYKWAGIVWWGEYVYYCYDNTPGKVMKCKYSDIGDHSKHEIVLDNLPNDCIGLFIGERGDMLVSQSIYRTGDTHSPFSASSDALNLYYSADREHFELIRTINPSNGSGTYYGFFGANKDGRIVSGFWKSSINLDRWDKLPSVDLVKFVKNAGYTNAFKPIDTNYEIIPVLQIECDSVSVSVNEEKELPVKVYPYNASVKTWSVIEYDSTYISVDGDTITGVATGETEVTIRSNSNYDAIKKFTVTVS